MKITVIGATGMVGSRIVAEAADRGHDIIAASRHPVKGAEARPVAGTESGAEPAASTGPAVEARPKVRPIAIDALNSADLDRALTDTDAAVLTVRAIPSWTQQFLTLTEAVLTATARARVPLLIVGGAGPLRTPKNPTALVLDDPAFVAAEWKDLAAASLAQLEVCQNHENSHWTYLSPPAILEPGSRLGEYQRGTTTPLLGRDRRSRISAEDLAAAVIDELEASRGERHFTVAAR